MRSDVLAACGVVVAALTLTACGGGSSNSSGSPTSPSPGSTTISITGELRSQSFAPNPAFVGGRAVAWRNDDNAMHRIVANDGSFDTGNLAPGATSAAIPMAEGGLNYHCSIHPTTMFGAIGGGGGSAPPPCDDIYCDE